MKIQDHIEKRVREGEGTWIDWQYLLDAALLVIKVNGVIIIILTEAIVIIV